MQRGTVKLSCQDLTPISDPDLPFNIGQARFAENILAQMAAVGVGVQQNTRLRELVMVRKTWYKGRNQLKSDHYQVSKYLQFGSNSATKLL